MDSEAPFVVAVVAIVMGSLVTMVRMWLNRPRRGDLPPTRLEAIEERLSRMEQAIDSIAVETERISEGQRYTTRLLAERPREPDSAANPPAGGR